MPDQQRAGLAAVLDDLCQAVGADAGGTLYLDDGDGTLLVAAASATAGAGLAGVVRRLSGGVLARAILGLDVLYILRRRVDDRLERRVGKRCYGKH